MTPESLKQGDYQFSVSTNPVQDGVAFHVVIENSQSDIYPDSRAGVDMVTQKQVAAGGSDESIEPVKQAILVMLKKESRVWTADFKVSNELLKRTDISFVFSVIEHSKINGKMIKMPSATFYKLRLQDFSKS